MKLIFFLFTFVLSIGLNAKTPVVTSMKVSGLTEPLGIDRTPTFSWQTISKERGFKQKSYEITVKDADGTTVWKSTAVASKLQTGILYEGKTLKSCSAYTWTVKVTGEDGSVSKPATSTFETAFMSPTEWTAKWITTEQDGKGSVPYYGHNFSIDRKVKRARIYASGLGVFTMHLNGQPVTENKLEPGEAEYEKTVLYSTYDVTSLLHKGSNILLAQVAGGIYNIDYLEGKYSKGEIKNKGTTGLLAELHIEYTDGTKQIVVTNRDWRYTSSPTLGSNWWGGEDYDARLRIDNIYSANLDISQWNTVNTFTPHFTSTQASGFGTLRSRMYEPLRVVEEWQAVDVKTVYSGGYKLQVVDFGRNFAGQYKFRLKGKEGQPITLRQGESLNADGSVLMQNFYTGPSDQIDSYTFRGDAKGEEWGPEFMYHGFRYLQIIGLDETPDPASFTAARIRSNMANSGTFNCSNQLLNDIHIICRDAIASQLYNCITDCPQREKLGWLDVPNLMFNSLAYNFDMQNFFRKVVLDSFDSQYPDGRVPSTAPHYASIYDNDPNWGGAAIIVPYRCWKTYADKSLMTEYYPQMKRLLDYYTSHTTNHIMNNISVLSDWGQETAKVTHMVPSEFTITTTYHHLLRIMAEMATELGHSSDAIEFTTLADKVKEAFNKKYYGQYTEGHYGHGQQSEMAMPLYYGLVDETNEEAVAKLLAERVAADNYKIKTGEVALKPLFMSLARFGYNDIVYHMANQTDCPSYGYWVKQGYTTTPEYWDVGAFSQNHCMMDHIEEWFFGEMAGIRDAGYGFDRISIKPWIPADIKHLTVNTLTNYGEIKLAYAQNDATHRYDIDVPANTTATITLPLSKKQRIIESGQKVKKGKRGVHTITKSDSTITFEVGSGQYKFEVK